MRTDGQRDYILSLYEEIGQDIEVDIDNLTRSNKVSRVQG